MEIKQEAPLSEDTLQILCPEQTDVVTAVDQEAEIIIPAGLYLQSNSQALVSGEYANPAATEDILYRSDFLHCFGECSVSTDGDIQKQNYNTEDLSCLELMYYTYEENVQKKGFDVGVADGGVKLNRKIKYLATGAAGGANIQFTISFPFKNFLPFLTPIDQDYYFVQDTTSVKIKYTRNLNVLINRTIANSALAALAATNLSITLNMCKIPDAEIERPLKASLVMYNFRGMELSNLNKVPTGSLSEIQGILFLDLVNYNTILNFGLFDYAAFKVDDEKSTVFKDGFNVIDSKFENNFEVQEVDNFIDELGVYNKQQQSSYAVAVQDEYFSETSFTYRVDLEEALGMNFLEFIEYVQE